MTWFAVDDRFPTHSKVYELRQHPAHDSALALWLMSGAWCAGQDGHALTGHVPAHMVSAFGVTEPLAAAEALTDVGLWEKRDGGWWFHDWSHWNGPDAKHNRSREQTRARQHAKRLRDCEAGQHSKDCPTMDADGGPWLCPRRAEKAAGADSKSARNAASRDAGTGRDGTGRDGTGRVGTGTWGPGSVGHGDESASATVVTAAVAADFLPPKLEVQP